MLLQFLTYLVAFGPAIIAVAWGCVCLLSFFAFCCHPGRRVRIGGALRRLAVTAIAGFLVIGLLQVVAWGVLIALSAYSTSMNSRLDAG